MNEQGTSELRERIEAALRARYSTSRVTVEVQEHGVSQWRAIARLHGDALGDVVRSRVSDTEADALAALAYAAGLNDDESDPRAELETLRAAALADVGRLTAERDAAYAIIAGRDTPPTDAEVEAHARVNGLGSAWLCMWEGRPRVIEHSSGVRYIRGTGGRPWWPLDATGRPCAWPTVTP